MQNKILLTIGALLILIGFFQPELNIPTLGGNCVDTVNCVIDAPSNPILLEKSRVITEIMKNPDLLKEVVPTESELKDIIVNYVGNKINPTNDEVTVEDIINVFAEQFPEFLLVLAEENWINGYTQALNDSKAMIKKPG